MRFASMSTLAQGGCFALLLLAVLLTTAVSGPRQAHAQEVSLSGFVKSSYYFDSRQVAAARDIDFMIWPLPSSDANDEPNLGSFQLFSRLGLNVDGFEDQVLGADVRAYFEADFFGPGGLTGGQENIFRLRRGFAEMNWENRSLLFGLEWSPLFTLAAFPHTVATEAGTPFNPFARQPMIKLTLKPGNLRLIGAAAWQFDAFQSAAFVTDGSALSGIDQQQRSLIPGMHGQVQYVSDALTVGGGGYVKALRPVPTGDRMFTSAGLAYVAFAGEGFNVRLKGIYGGDLHDHVKTAGIIYDQAQDEDDAFVADAFQALNSVSGWIEVEKTGTIAPGIFAGYLTNLGATDEVSTDVIATGRGLNIKSLWEVAPRLALNYGPMRFALEAQITTAAFAAAFDENYAPTGPTDDVTNIRGNFSVFLFF